MHSNKVVKRIISIITKKKFFFFVSTLASIYFVTIIKKKQKNSIQINAVIGKSKAANGPPWFVINCLFTVACWKTP